MRSEEINKWINEGGSPPQDLTQEEHRHLTKLGWSVKEGWWDNGQKQMEWDYFHGKAHGKWKEWDFDYGSLIKEEEYLHGMRHGAWKEWNTKGKLTKDEEYFYGNRIK